MISMVDCRINDIGRIHFNQSVAVPGNGFFLKNIYMENGLILSVKNFKTTKYL